MDESSLYRYATLLNCKVTIIPFTYLCIPIAANPRRKSMWEPMLDKLRSKLPCWKQKSLSFGGRMILINSILSFLPFFILLSLRYLLVWLIRLFYSTKFSLGVRKEVREGCLGEFGRCMCTKRQSRP